MTVSGDNMAITTYSGRARRALLHKTNSTYWVAVGRTTPWGDDLAPPSPNPSVVDIEEAIIFVKAEYVSLAKFVQSGGDVIVKGDRYSFVQDGDAILEQARFLYIRGRFDPSQGQPYGTFRQIAVFSNVVPATGHEDDTWLAPADISSRGVLEYIDNKPPTQMDTESEEVIQAIIEFR